MKNIFVGNLDFNTSEDELRQLFQAYGQVDRVSIMTDRDTGRSRGFGFVEMANAEEGEKAIAALNGNQVGGRTLNVNEARPKVERARRRWWRRTRPRWTWWRWRRRQKPLVGSGEGRPTAQGRTLTQSLFSLRQAGAPDIHLDSFPCARSSDG